MPDFFSRSQITDKVPREERADKSSPSQPLKILPAATGHKVHLDKQIEIDGTPREIIYKENKYGNPELSYFEAAFGELATLFIYPHLVPEQNLVEENGKIVGLVCRKLNQAIHEREKVKDFYEIKVVADQINLEAISFTTDEEIPYHFLDHFEPGFFHHLLAAEQRGQLSFDYASLASVLAASYTLEEDDLHKGNFGFYIVKRDEKPCVVFFKIDHDMMMADSIMSRYSSRLLHWSLGDGAFNPMPEDLLHFPNISNASMGYWVTRKGFSLFTGKKGYTDSAELEAFRSLAENAQFNEAKWMAFYKHTLIPIQLIKESLTKHYDITNPEQCAKVDLIVNSAVERQAKIRADLFSLPEFRQFVRNLNDQQIRQLSQEAACGIKLKAKTIKERIKNHQKLCAHFKEGDTPLHAAIRLRDYRFQESWKSFSRYSHVENSLGETPLDTAVKMAQTEKESRVLREDPRREPFYIIAHLVQCGVRKTAAFFDWPEHKAAMKKDYLVEVGFLQRVKKKFNIDQFIQLLGELGSDPRFALKMKKEIAIEAFKKFLKDKKEALPPKEYRVLIYELKIRLNGTPRIAPDARLQFIRQLRSQLWIVRFFRGLIGNTSTQIELNNLFDKQLRQSPKSSAGCFSFIYHPSSKHPKEPPHGPKP